MKKRFSKIISLLMVICLVLTAVPTSAFGAELSSDAKNGIPSDEGKIMELSLGETFRASGKAGESVFYHYTFQKDGEYVFSSYDEEAGDPFCNLYDAAGNLIEGYDSAVDAGNFQIMLSCKAGDEYYFEAKDNSGSDFAYFIRLVEYTDDFTVSVKDMTLTEADSYLAEEIIYVDGEPVPVTYKKYYYYPTEMSVSTSGGETFTGSIFELPYEMYDTLGYWVIFEITDDQSAENPWESGDHTAYINWRSKRCAFTVTILESLVESMTVTDLHKLEGDVTTHYEEVLTDGETEYIEYLAYDVLPAEISVTMADGKVYTGAPPDITDQLEKDYNRYFIYSYTSDQSSENHWDVGTHTATFTLGGYSCDFNVIIDAYPILSVEVPDLILCEGNTNPAVAYTPEDGIPVEYDEYDIFPSEITVTDREGKTYTGYVYNVLDEINAKYGCNLYYEIVSDQSYDNVWTAGTHTAAININGKEWPYNVIIKENPILSVSVEDIILAEGDTYPVGISLPIDDDYVYVEYPEYDIYPKQLSLVTKDGKEYTGAPFEVIEAFGNDYGFRVGFENSSDQSYENQWGPGTHTATFSICGVSCEYHIIIRESLVESIILTDVVIYEGEAIERGEYVEIDGEEVYVEYTYYDVRPDEMTLTTTDGKVYTGNFFEVVTQLQSDYGRIFDYRNSSDQSYQNIWDLGTHEAVLTFDNKSWYYNVIIKENPVIASVQAEDCTVYEDESFTAQEEVFDEETGYVTYEYEKYPDTPDRITVTLTTGEVYSGRFSDVINPLHGLIPYTITSDQSYETPWKKGTHPVTLDIGGKTCTYNVTVIDPLVKSVSAENKVLYKNDGNITRYFNGDDTYTEYRFYDAIPESITVMTSDGKSYTGAYKDILNSLEEKYGFAPSCRIESYQSVENEWGLGNHTCDFRLGLAETTYTVSVIPPEATRLYGKGKFETAFLIADTLKDTLKTDKFDNVIIAGSGGFADALAGSYLAARKKAPILLTSAKDTRINNVVNYVKQNLKAGGTVYILGGEAAVPKTLEAALKGVNCRIKRLAGAQRYETNRAILDEAGVDENSEILVSTGTNFADSLSASATGLPILLVSDKNLEKNETKAYLTSLKGKNVNFTILGGTSAVSENAEKILSTYGSVKRLSGKDRFETSVNLAKNYFRKPTDVTLAYSHDFPDGLCVGPLAYTLGAPLILTRDKNANVAADYVADYSKVHRGYIIGGPVRLSDEKAVMIFGLRKASDIKPVYREK